MAKPLQKKEFSIFSWMFRVGIAAFFVWTFTAVWSTHDWLNLVIFLLMMMLCILAITYNHLVYNQPILRTKYMNPALLANTIYAIGVGLALVSIYSAILFADFMHTDKSLPIAFGGLFDAALTIHMVRNSCSAKKAAKPGESNIPPAYVALDYDVGFIGVFVAWAIGNALVGRSAR